jgi:hypothetical protein
MAVHVLMDHVIKEEKCQPINDGWHVLYSVLKGQ